MSLHTSTGSPSIGLVLSGGGARGAYEAGVLAGISEVLSPRGLAGSPFDVVTGTSVGAINAAHVVAFADRSDQGIPKLLELWTSLQIETHLRLTRRWLWRLPKRKRKGGEDLESSRWGHALLDSEPFERMLGTHTLWQRIHDNIEHGLVRAFIVSALNVVNGRTVSFVELTPGATYVASHDPRRATRIEGITANHVLASAAIPLLFPARWVGGSYFCDGGLRFNTPMSPVIRAGAQRLLVVALRTRRPVPEGPDAIEHYPNPIFLVGKILDALLLDPIEYDLQVMQRLNRMLDVLPSEAQGEVARVVESDRGVPYRRVETLVFRPSEDIGVLALEHMRKRRRSGSFAVGASTALLEHAAALGAHVEADFLSYILFDGGFARTLIELGRRDVMARTAEVEAFFTRSGP